MSYLKKNDIDAMIIDLDNTIAPWDSDQVAEPDRQWLETVQSAGIRIMIVSNNKEKRVEQFAAGLGLPFIFSAAKPFKRSFLKAVELLGAERQRTVVVGDQIFTDVLGGNSLGLHTVLVEPMASKEFAGTKVLRAMERFVLKKITMTEGFDDE